MITPLTNLPERFGAAWAQCPVCRYVFTTVANFDRHRKNGRCLNPAEAGLVLNKRGMWCKPWLPLFTGGVSVEGEIPAGTVHDKGQAGKGLFGWTAYALLPPRPNGLNCCGLVTIRRSPADHRLIMVFGLSKAQPQGNFPS